VLAVMVVILIFIIGLLIYPNFPTSISSKFLSNFGASSTPTQNQQTNQIGQNMDKCLNQLNSVLNIAKAKLPSQAQISIVNTTIFYGKGDYQPTNVCLVNKVATYGSCGIQRVETSFTIPIAAWIKTWANLNEWYDQKLGCYDNGSDTGAYACDDLETIANESIGNHTSGISAYGIVVKIQPNYGDNVNVPNAALTIPILCDNNGTLLGSSENYIASGQAYTTS
jgi:hypothetical protein